MKRRKRHALFKFTYEITTREIIFEPNDWHSRGIKLDRTVEGTIPSTKVANQWRFKKARIDEWLMARENDGNIDFE